MSLSIYCDCCGASVPAHEVFNWFELTNFGHSVSTLNSGKGPWHFDSKKCLSLWAASQSNIPEKN